MKKAKQLRRKTYLLVGLLALVVVSGIGASVILGQAATEVNRVCEDGQGKLFVPRNKLGIIDECGNHADSIVFNFEKGMIGAGDIAFIDSGNNFVLRNDSTVWFYDDQVNKWRQDLERTIPSSVVVSNIVQWNNSSFLTRDGNVYILQDGWVNIGKPN